MLNRIADWLIARAQRTPYFHITDEQGSTYMERFWLIPYNRFGIAARVHHILRSDRDLHLHDHPWWSVSIILRGGYFEEVPHCHLARCVSTKQVWRGPGSIVFRRARDWHRLEVIPAEDGECWTLFVTGPKRKDGDPAHSCWGFLVDGVKVPADIYLGERYVPTDYRGAA